jgi:cyclophilin family peptidyl-prolyl cis-trans isomerase
VLVVFGVPLILSRLPSQSPPKQFFITLAKAPYLSSKFVAFGKVVAGFDMVDSIGSIECLNERPVGKCVIDGASEC